jgi:RNA recognition motif-containing protein
MNIHVTNLGEKITEESLQSVFANYGKVRSTKVINDRFSGYSRGFAFIEMANDDEALKAINKINGSIIDGRIIEVKEASAEKL